MTYCKEIKVPGCDGKQTSASLCTENPHRPTKYRWNDVDCEECLRMRSTLEEKAKQQRKQLNKDNK